MATGDPIVFCPFNAPWFGIVPPSCTCGHHTSATGYRPLLVGAEPIVDLADTGKHNREMAAQLRDLADQLDPPEPKS